jgi:hypothetical protein
MTRERTIRVANGWVMLVVNFTVALTAISMFVVGWGSEITSIDDAPPHILIRFS